MFIELTHFSGIRSSDVQMRRWLGLALGWVLLLTTFLAWSQGAMPSRTNFLKESSAMSWKTECIGRVLIDMPIDRPRSWSAQVEEASVRRLQRPLSLAQFWAGVETVRNRYARQKHDEHSSRLGHFERIDARKAAIVIGYDNGDTLWGPDMWRFVHLDDQHAYEFKTEAIGTRGAAPSPELFKPYIEQYTPVLSRITALREGEIPTSEGLCFDGAMVSGETGHNASAALTVEIATGTYLGLGYRENLFRATRSSAFELLELDRKQADFGLSFAKEPTAYKEFKVLRRQERTLGGLLGQEFITRTTLNNGHVHYRFLWALKGGEDNILEPGMQVHMNTPKDKTNAKGQAYVELPAEAELIALWDSALRTFRLRPSALPAGQMLRAVN